MDKFRKHLESIFPVMIWGRGYELSKFRSDAVAGVVVLFITVPQVIAYAFLAGMPAEAGLYAAMIALVAYAAFGSSKALAVGPTAIVAMMTFEAASEYAVPGELGFSDVVVQLCAVTGVVLVVLRLIRFGSIVAFLSHAVVTGFITAAAILIISNQFPSMLGLAPSLDTSIVGVYSYLAEQFTSLNQAVVWVSACAVVILVFCRTLLAKLLGKLGLKPSVIDSLVKSAPMYAVIIGVLMVQLLSLDTAYAVPVVGEIPTRLPHLSLALMSLEQFQNLLPSALLISMVIFMESTSIGTAIASKSRDKIDANQELAGLGAANLGSSLVGGFPVAGSFARSVVNFSSGAVSPVASLITALLVAITILVFAAAFYHLPKGVLSAIIVISAWQLIDVQAIKKILTFNRTDAVTFSLTFLAVLAFGVESGVLIGIVVSFILLIRSSSKPHIAVVGRVGESEHFRNVERHETKTSPKVLAMRVDESLYFVNTRFIESFVLNHIADAKEVEHLLLICTSTNFIDTSGLEMLEELSENLLEVGVTLHMAEVKGPVMDKLKETGFYQHMSGKIFFTTDVAMKELAGI
jgi:SulP family sulfate permease